MLTLYIKRICVILTRAEHLFGDALRDSRFYIDWLIFLCAV